MKMSETIIGCKVTAVHPTFDATGGELICVEFSVEAKQANVFAMPSNASPEVMAVMPLLKQLPKMLPQSRAYNNRLILYLATQEWEKLTKKYSYGDEFEIRITGDGTITVKRLIA
jgi:hypothetical protein